MMDGCHDAIDTDGVEDIKRREAAVIAAEADVLRRDKLARAREDAVQLRETAVTSREWRIRVAEALEATSADHMLKLQQANSHLIVASIEAQKLTEQVEAAKVQLENAKVVAETANHAKSDFLSSMSHELRSPLNAILGFAQLMESGSPPPTPTQKARIGQILQAGWYLLELVNEILDLALIESGTLSLALEPVSLPNVLLDCRAMIESQAEKSSIRISFPQFDGPCFVMADRIHLKQVLTNLLSNAIKYNRVGGTVEVRCSVSTPERTHISVQDTGAGLPADKLAQLFQPFNRLGQEASNVKGTGIGLVASKRLIELMGGEIGVQSTVGMGSVFWFELNRAVAPLLAPGADSPFILLHARDMALEFAETVSTSANKEIHQ
ncbi:sensor histidine kinase [Rhodoferax ferrireducens]|uniref:sensor histidine kinase n=1 Tax=Rhodoferax ferrireducens TaxID=192843 RepID=UPI003B3B3343